MDGGGRETTDGVEHTNTRTRTLWVRLSGRTNRFSARLFYLFMCPRKGMIYWGQRAYDTLDAIMQEMKDPQVVQGMFARFDRDHNGGKLRSKRTAFGLVPLALSDFLITI